MESSGILDSGYSIRFTREVTLMLGCLVYLCSSNYSCIKMIPDWKNAPLIFSIIPCKYQQGSADHNSAAIYFFLNRLKTTIVSSRINGIFKGRRKDSWIFHKNNSLWNTTCIFEERWRETNSRKITKWFCSFDLDNNTTSCNLLFQSQVASNWAGNWTCTS